MPTPLPSSRALRLAFALTSLSFIAGCQQTTLIETEKYPDVDPKVQEAFAYQLMGVLRRDGLSATQMRMYGALDLKVTLDTQSRPVACSTARARPEFVAQLPEDLLHSDFETLSQAIEAQCWKTIYPVAPAGLFDEEGTLQVIVPLLLTPPEAETAYVRKLALKQSRAHFFWQAVVRDEAVDSIGRALFRFKTDAAGKITGCLVQLAPTDVRAEAFHMDGALQARLSSRCMGVQTPATPGFAPDPQGPELGFAIVEYAPWKVGRP